MQLDESIYKGCVNGDRKAQRQLYEQCSRHFLAVCLRYSKNRDDAEDILQESFVKIFRGIGKLKESIKLYAWMKRIVVNTALNYYRSRYFMVSTVDVELAEAIPDDSFSLEGYSQEELLGLIQALPAGSQVVFNLYVFEGCKHQEIAEMLGISESTSKTQYMRAKAILKDLMTKAQKKNYGRFR